MTREERRKLIEEKRTKELSDSISILKANNYVIMSKSTVKEDLKNFINNTCKVIKCDDNSITIVDKLDYKELTIDFDDYYITFGERIGILVQSYPEVWTYEYNEIIAIMNDLYGRAYIF